MKKKMKITGPDMQLLLECLAAWIKKFYCHSSCKPKKGRLQECPSCQGWDVVEFLEEISEEMSWEPEEVEVPKSIQKKMDAIVKKYGKKHSPKKK